MKGALIAGAVVMVACWLEGLILPSGWVGWSAPSWLTTGVTVVIYHYFSTRLACMAVAAEEAEKRIERLEQSVERLREGVGDVYEAVGRSESKQAKWIERLEDDTDKRIGFLWNVVNDER